VPRVFDYLAVTDINEFVPKSDIDPRYLIRPYYLVPDSLSPRASTTVA
jgi:non-homologous end joining protein Ku